jgi:hypothetical protein
VTGGPSLVAAASSPSPSPPSLEALEGFPVGEPEGWPECGAATTGASAAAAVTGGSVGAGSSPAGLRRLTERGNIACPLGITDGYWASVAAGGVLFPHAAAIGAGGVSTRWA